MRRAIRFAIPAALVFAAVVAVTPAVQGQDKANPLQFGVLPNLSSTSRCPASSKAGSSVRSKS
jgi:hypothetical protein